MGFFCMSRKVGELVAQDAPAVFEAMETKLADNERVIAELQDASHLLHRLILAV